MLLDLLLLAAARCAQPTLSLTQEENGSGESRADRALAGTSIQ